MKKSIHILYAICVVGIFSLFLYLCGEFKNEVFDKRQDAGYQYLTEYEREQIQDDSAPAGIRSEYTMSQTEIPEGGRSLIFYTIHQNVQVYIGGELVYSQQPSRNNPFGKTPGNNWNTIPIYETDAGKEIKIVLIPVYESSIDIVPEFYFGSKVSIWREIIGESLSALVLSLVAILLGIVFMAFAVANYRNIEKDNNLFMMGMFSLNIGLWKMCDMDAMSLLFQNSIPLSYIPFFALLLVVVPFVLYIKELFSEEKKIWYILCYVSIFVIVFSSVLEIFQIADFRQTLWLNHLVMGAVLCVGIVMLIRELRLVGWSRKLKIMVICLGSCLAGTMADICIYYVSSGTTNTVMGMLGFLIYIILLGVMSVREVSRLLTIGRKAKHYEQMAYHDQLTGLYNRAAYADYVEKLDLKTKDCILIMLDLNNLKQCNDTLGHDKGDAYISNSAKLIHEVFGRIGKCYRMGGDEFCVFLKEVSLEKCQKLVEKLRVKTEEWNRESQEKFEIKIACGYARYEKEVDYDLGDTLRRADRMMYHEKFDMKQE